jgi:hypothetical protein
LSHQSQSFYLAANLEEPIAIAGDNCPRFRKKATALKPGFVTESEFDRVVDPAKTVKHYVATNA